MSYTQLFARHSALTLLAIMSLVTAVCLSCVNGIAKPLTEIEWLDVVGEGSVAAFALLWILAAITSRPPGKVTTLLVAGLTCFLFSATLDLLDEYFSYSGSAHWLSMVESIPAALGMIIMTVALYYWHIEQLAINRQLSRREGGYRNHDDIDPITQLYQGAYWLDRAESLISAKQPACILLLDVNRFAEFNKCHGQREGDRFLRELSQLLMMHVREDDLVSRYAGDRFVLLLPGLTLNEANRLEEEIARSVRFMAFKCNQQTTAVFNSVSTAAAEINEARLLSQTLSKLNQVLDDRHDKVA